MHRIVGRLAITDRKNPIVRKTPPAKMSAQDAHAMLEMMKVKTKEYVQRLKGEHAVETESLRKLVSDSSEEVKTLKGETFSTC